MKKIKIKKNLDPLEFNVGNCNIENSLPEFDRRILIVFCADAYDGDDALWESAICVREKTIGNGFAWRFMSLTTWSNLRTDPNNGDFYWCYAPTSFNGIRKGNYEIYNIHE